MKLRSTHPCSLVNLKLLAGGGPATPEDSSLWMSQIKGMLRKVHLSDNNLNSGHHLCLSSRRFAKNVDLVPRPGEVFCPP